MPTVQVDAVLKFGPCVNVFAFFFISKPRPLFVMLFITISAGGGGEVMVVSVSFSLSIFLVFGSAAWTDFNSCLVSGLQVTTY